MGLLLFLFTISGAAGLMYESIWSRYLGLFVGHSAYAQIIVLVIFLGGMSVGAWLVGRRSAELKDPLRWYAVVELGAGVLGALFHPLFRAVTGAAYDALLPALPGGAAVVVVKWLVAALLILPQSVLLGATFPLMSAGAMRRVPGSPGRVLALLYFTNSLGAAGGVLVAGFGLLGAVGLPGTLLVAAGINVLVAALAYALTLLPGSAVTEPPLQGIQSAANENAPAATQPPPNERATEREDRSLATLLLAVAFGTAVASFVYEVAWLRMLSLVVGSATHSFEIMLSVFILGLALGAWWVRARADRLTDPVRTLGIVQWVMGSVAIATLPIYLKSYDWMVALLGALDTTPQGYTLFSLARYALCLAVMLPATFCAGMTLPLITRTLYVRGAGESAIGRVYAVNTLGSIVGAALAGLVLMPVLGLKWLLVAGALVDVALGFALLLRYGMASERVTTLVVVPATLGMLLFVAVRTPFHPATLTSGVYRYASVAKPEHMRMLFYRDGRTATVSVRQATNGNTISLATNGKPDASLTVDWVRPTVADTVRHPLAGDQVTQALLPLVTLAHAPNARSVAVIGQGSGMTSHLLLASPQLQRLSTIDIEPAMIDGSRQFYPANRRVFDDPRSRFVLDDAKSFFSASDEQFDVIVSEPSNPWVSGVSGLFTNEFYGRVRGWLTPNGIFGQWLHLYEIDDRLVLDVLAALHRNFRAYDIYLVSTGDILVVATNGARVPAPDWRVFDLPALGTDLRRTLPLDSLSLASARLIDRAALAPLLDRWRPVNSDFCPVLDLGAEKTRFIRARATGFRELSTGRFDPVAAMRGWRIPFSDVARSPVELPRAKALALGAATRGAWARWSGGDSTARDVADEQRDALYRRAAFENVLATGRAPVDWMRFIGHTADVLDDVHGGTAGVVDSALYARLFAFLARTGAPNDAVAAVRFIRALEGWSWAEAAPLADTLIAAQTRGERWVSPSLLHDGSVVSALRLGDSKRARQFFTTTFPATGRRPDDLRAVLLPAWIGLERP